MNKHNLYSIYDSKVEGYMQPFFLPNDQVAMRAFSDLVNEDNHDLNRHPEDYTLFNLATFDPTSGTVTPQHTPKALITGISAKRTLTEEN